MRDFISRHKLRIHSFSREIISFARFSHILYLGIALVYKLKMDVKNVLIQLSKITTKCKLGNGTHKSFLMPPHIFSIWNSILMFYTAFDNGLNHFDILEVLLALILALTIDILIIFLHDHLKFKYQSTINCFSK